MERIPDVSRRVAIPEPEVVVEHGAGKVTLRRRRFGPLRARIVGVFGIPPDVTISLDAMGTEAWRLIDGRRTVADVLEGLQAKFPTETDLSARLGRFIGALVSRRMLRLE